MNYNLPPTHDTEPKPIDDNARKFVIKPLDPELIAANGLVSYYMDVYWTDTAEDTETKVVRKIFRYTKKDDELLRIQKVKSPVSGKRTAVKTPITQDEFDYASLDYPGIPALQKRRTELNVIQDGNDYVLKYDEFTAGSAFDFREGNFFMMEVEPPKWVSEDERESYVMDFDPSRFLEVVEEVSGDPEFEGYRIVETLKGIER